MGVIDEVIAALKLDELIGLLPYVIEVEIPVYIGTVLHGGLYLDQFAGFIKVIITASHTDRHHILKPEVDVCADYILAVRTGEIIVALKLDQLVCSLSDVVQIEIPILIGAILHGNLGDDHLAGFVKLVLPGRQVGPFKDLLAEIQALTDRVLAVLADEVIAALKGNQLIGLLPHVIQVEIPVLVGAVLHRRLRNDHLAGLVKLVLSGGQAGPCENLLAKIQVLADRILAVLADEVVAALKLDQLICSLSDVVQVEISVRVGAVLHVLLWDDHLAGLVKLVLSGGQARTFQVFLSQIDGLAEHILAIFTDEVEIAFKGNQLVRILLDILQIEVAVFVGAVLENHPAELIEIVIADLEAGPR